MTQSFIVRFLNLFTEIKKGEVKKALLLTSSVFFLLVSYYIAKVVREPLILAGGGAEIKSYAALAQGALIAGLMPVYSHIAEKFSRRVLINGVTLFFFCCFLIFYFLAKVKAPFLGVAFFIWVGIFSLITVAQFWSFSADVYNQEQGERLLVLVGFGASAGSVVGPKISEVLIGRIGIYELLIFAAGFLLINLVLLNFIESQEKDPHAKAPPEFKENIYEGKNAFTVVFKSRYILMIATFVLVTNWVNTNGEYILGRVVSENAAEATGVLEDEHNFIGSFYAEFYFYIGLFSMLIQLFLVSRIVKYFSLQIAILILPIIAMGAYGLMAVFPVISMIRWPKIVENATNYSLNNTVRHMLFLPTTKEEKYQGKVVIDSFFWRIGDIFSTATVFVGSGLLLLAVEHFAMFNLGICVLWIFIGIIIGRQAKSRSISPEEN